MTDLSKRLLAVASFAEQGGRVADVGTDHGFLPIYLIEQGKAAHVIAMDVRRGPLSRAAEHVREAGLEGQIELRLGNGLEALKSGEADTVVIAGMGGPLILEILQNGARVTPSVKRFILSPQSDWRGVRLGLESLELTISRENMVFEDGNYYVILEAVHRDNAGEELSGAPSGRRETELRFGRRLLEEKSPVLLDYLIWQENILTGILHKLAAGSTPEADRRRAEVETELAFVREAMNRIKAPESFCSTISEKR